MTETRRTRFRFDEFEIDDDTRVLERAGEPVPVSRKATEALLVLLERPGRVVTKEELFARVWPDVIVDENNLSQCVSALRRALGDDRANPRYVATVPRRGFRFVARVEHDEGAASAAAARERPVVAVLPFRVEPAGSKVAALGAGLAEELASRLAAEPAVRARPASSVAALADGTGDPSDVGRRLGARFVLAGVVRESGAALRVSAEWIRVADGVAVWAERFSDRIDDLFALEERIAEKIVEGLPLAGGGPAPRTVAPRSLVGRPPSNDVETYLLYLRGRHFANRLTREGYAESGAAFRSALARDPSYALAWVGLAYRDLMALDLFARPVEVIPSVRRSTERALALDPTLAPARCARIGLSVYCEWDRAAAERGVAEVLAGGEPEPSVARELAWFLTLLGRFEEGLALFARAAEVDPVSFEQAMYQGGALYIARRYGEARRVLEGMLDLWPNYWLADVLLGRCDEAEGDLPSAIARYRRAAESAPEVAESLGDLARALGLSGRSDEARAHLDAIVAKAAIEYVTPHAVAQAQFGLGNLEGAFAALDAAYADRSWYLAWIRLIPTMDPFRRDPRFAALVRRIGL